MPSFVLDPRLAADTLHVAALPLSDVRLMARSDFPWVVLIPRVHDISELIDLEPTDRHRLLDEIVLATEALRAETGCDKLNIAAIGNIVAQLHVHVVARFRADPAWPAPVWGRAPTAPRSDIDDAHLIARLRARLNKG
jgi:diadenosine tetraphosphate (Ap4A) HIT family hydrolase